MARPLLASLLLAAAPLLLAACGGEDNVSRGEAAACESAVRVWEAGYWLDDSSAESQQAIRDAAAEVRATCTPRTFPVAVAAAEASDRDGNAFSLDAACEGDPYRESRLCADVPQPRAGD
jgi:hypothetical protein